MSNDITNENDLNQLLSADEIDTIGEILNISMGSAATSLSTLLDKKVDITTPSVKIIKAEDLKMKHLEPAIGVEISYIKGLDGSNLLIMKKSDIRIIVGLLMGETVEDDNSELDEIHLSAVSEIMNQMMGASSTALAKFLGRDINISTPNQFDPEKIQEKINESLFDPYLVTVGFEFKVEGLINSEFVTILSIPFTKEVVENAINVNSTTESPAAKKDVVKSSVSSVPVKEAPAEEKKRSTPSKKVDVQPLTFTDFDKTPEAESPDGQVNYGLVMGVELEITVEIGRTRKPVKDILELRTGAVLELDKQAGDPVDVIVNGKLIARGDVVVIEENFGVRITEIVSQK